jgi:hypothetical protein
MHSVDTLLPPSLGGAQTSASGLESAFPAVNGAKSPNHAPLNPQT